MWHGSQTGDATRLAGGCASTCRGNELARAGSKCAWAASHPPGPPLCVLRRWRRCRSMCLPLSTTLLWQPRPPTPTAGASGSSRWCWRRRCGRAALVCGGVGSLHECAVAPTGQCGTAQSWREGAAPHSLLLCCSAPHTRFQCLDRRPSAARAPSISAQIALKLLLDKVMDEDGCRGDSNGPFDEQTVKERRAELKRDKVRAGGAAQLRSCPAKLAGHQRLPATPCSCCP